MPANVIDTKYGTMFCLRYIEADAMDLSAFDTASFDAVVSTATLFMLPDPLK